MSCGHVSCHRQGSTQYLAVADPTILCCIRAGFAVVKRGRDKLTGEPVAIKVNRALRSMHHLGMISLLSTAAAHLLCCASHEQ